MIRKANIDDIDGIFSLLKTTYSNHSLISRGVDDFVQNLQNSKYISFIAVQGGKIAGHAGIYLQEDFSLLNAFCVRKGHRGNGLGKLLFQARLDETAKLRRRYTVGYAMMQHPFSQTLYDDSFFSIGMTFGYRDIFNQGNNSFNCGESNAEIVLCKAQTNKYITRKIFAPKSIRDDLGRILEKMKVKPIWFDDESKKDIGFFTGLCPTRDNGLFNIEYVPWNENVDFNKMVTTNEERAEFKQWVQSRY